MTYGMDGWCKEIPGGDLISRAEAIDAICNSACGSKFCGLPCDDVAALKALPYAQPEIIRCKDCKEYQTDWETRFPNKHYCATMDSFMSEDEFCSYAERLAKNED